MLIGALFGLVVIAALLFFADYQAVTFRLIAIDLRLVPLILILAPLNYLLRYIKWNYYLKISGIRPDRKTNRYIFLSGLAMTITPGKVGELWKCYLLKKHLGSPISLTAPIIMAERVTDGLAIIILTCAGLFIYPYGLVVVGFVAGLLVCLILFFQCETLFNFITNWLSGFKPLDGAIAFSKGFYRSSRGLLSARHLPFAVGLGVISWSFEGLIIYLAVYALGGEFSILGSFFAIGLSTLAGAVSFMPGGLGAAEASIMAILITAGLARDLAAAVTLITRFSTLWLGVAIGFIGLIGAYQLIFATKNKDKTEGVHQSNPGRKDS